MENKIKKIKEKVMQYLKMFPVIEDCNTGKLAKGILGDLLFAEYNVEKAIDIAIYETLELRQLEPNLQEIIRKERNDSNPEQSEPSIKEQIKQEIDKDYGN